MVCIAKHSSTKYTPFYFIYNINPVTPFELTNNQWDSNLVPPRLSGDSVSINEHITNMEHIYQSMFTKSPTILRSPRQHSRSITTCEHNTNFSM